MHNERFFLLIHWVLFPCTAPVSLRPLLKECRVSIENRSGCAVLMTLCEVLKDPVVLPFLASGRNDTSSSTES